MSFLNPTMLIGLAALAIPIIVHLLNRRRFKKVPWAAMRFLQVSVERNQRRMKVEDWILLLMRLLMIALLVLGLARPAANWFKSQFLGSKIASAVVVDRSGSMQRKDTGAAGDRFETATAAALEVIDSLPRGSAASMVLAADTGGEGVMEPTHDLARARKALAGATASDRSSDLLPAIEAALSSLKGHTAGQRELTIITDGEATAWRQYESITRQLESAGDDLRTVVALVGNAPGENLSLSRLVQSTPVAAIGQPLRLSVEVANHGRADAGDIPVQIEINGEASGEPVEINEIPAGETRSVTLFARLPAAGFHQIRASIPSGDALPNDDERTIVVRAIEREQVLLVDGKPGRSPAEGETFFLQNALVPVTPEMADRFFLATERITVADLAATALEDYRVIFMANVAEFPTTVADQLESFVRAGGGLVVFSGENINASFYNAELHDKRALLPAAFGAVATEDLLLQPSGYDHPLVELWNDPGAGTLADATIGKAHQLELDEDQPRGAVVLRYSNGLPAVMENSLGLGVVYQFSTTADTEWNDLAVRPAFLPIVHRLVGSVLAKADAGLNLRVGDSFERRGAADWLGKAATIYPAGGSGQGTAIDAIADANGSRLRFDKIDRSGAYELTIADPPLSLPFAAAPDPRESDPESLAPAQLQRLSEVAEVITINDGQTISEALGRSRSGAELWPLLLLAAGVIAVMEMFLAQRFSQEK